MLCLSHQAAAQDELAYGSQTVEDLRRLSIDQLVDLPVTSVSRRPESLAQAPAAIYVITSADIRRLGVTSLPEVLRLAPNLEVARANAYTWTVTARGFNSSQTANKLLVLVDGRSVYEPIGSGVIWPQVNVATDNIERIEVISGAGGTIWGANAVNGVINIITKDAAATQGLYLRAAGGIYRRSATARYGGSIGDTVHYRVFADGFRTGTTHPVLDTDTFKDAHSGWSGGFALDATVDKDAYSLKADVYDNAVVNHAASFKGHSVLGDWSRSHEDGSTTSVQASIDHNERREPVLFESRDTFSMDAHHAWTWADRHQIVIGGEFRHWWENFTSYNNAQFAQPKTTIALGSLFAQDVIALRPDLKLTLGLKAEHSSYSGLDWLPNVRLAWQVSDNALLWGAVSKAVRTPSRIERELRADVVLLPSPDFQAEKLTAFEAGWRAQPSTRSYVSVAVFYNLYDDLRTWGYPATIFPLMLQNGARAKTYGLEAWGKYDVLPGWRLGGGANLLHKSLKLKPGYNDLSSLAVGGQDPNYQAQIRSEWNVTPTVDLDVTIRTVGEVTISQVPAYTEANVRLSWRVKEKVELAVIGSNLLNARHLEVRNPDSSPPRYLGRSIAVSIRYGY